jgi:hypothetical protein
MCISDFFTKDIDKFTIEIVNIEFIFFDKYNVIAISFVLLEGDIFF